MKQESSLRSKIISEIEQFLVKENFTVEAVCFFMQSIRILLEIDNSKDKYPITEHYCNWLLHKELNRKRSPKIIEEIATSLKVSNSKIEIINKIGKAIELQKLVSEIQEILWAKASDKMKIRDFDFETNWLKFIQVIISQVIYRPIKLNKSHIDISAFQITIYGFQIVTQKDKYCVELLSRELEKKDKRIIIDIAIFRDL